MKYFVRIPNDFERFDVVENAIQSTSFEFVCETKTGRRVLEYENGRLKKSRREVLPERS